MPKPVQNQVSRMMESKNCFVPFDASDTSFRLDEIAARSLGETEEKKKTSLQKLKILIRDQKVACISDDDFLLRFLRYRKFDIRKSFEALRNYSHQRRLLHKVLLELRPELVAKYMRITIQGFLPYLDSQGRIVWFCRPDFRSRMAEPKHTFIPFHAPASPSKLEEIAVRDFSETEERKKECLQKLRILIRDQKVTCISNEDFPLRFLRCKKFDIQKGFEALGNYAHQRRLFHERILKLRPELVETCLRLHIFGFFPYRDSQERIVYFVRLGAWNPKICAAEEILTIAFVFLCYIAEKASSQITGIIIVVDLSGLRPRYFPYIISNMWGWRNFSFNCVPVRYSYVHLVSRSVVLKYISFVVFPLVPKKIVERIVFHEDVGGTFFEYFPATTLPDIFGGTSGPVNHEHQTSIIMDYLEKMKEEHRYFQ